MTILLKKKSKCWDRDIINNRGFDMENILTLDLMKNLTANEIARLYQLDIESKV